MSWRVCAHMHLPCRLSLLLLPWSSPLFPSPPPLSSLPLPCPLSQQSACTHQRGPLCKGERPSALISASTLLMISLRPREGSREASSATWVADAEARRAACEGERGGENEDVCG